MLPLPTLTHLKFLNAVKDVYDINKDIFIPKGKGEHIAL